MQVRMRGHVLFFVFAFSHEHIVLAPRIVVFALRGNIEPPSSSVRGP